GSAGRVPTDRRLLRETRSHLMVAQRVRMLRDGSEKPFDTDSQRRPVDPRSCGMPIDGDWPPPGTLLPATTFAVRILRRGIRLGQEPAPPAARRWPCTPCSTYR